MKKPMAKPMAAPMGPPKVNPKPAPNHFVKLLIYYFFVVAKLQSLK